MHLSAFYYKGNLKLLGLYLSDFSDIYRITALPHTNNLYLLKFKK